MHHDIGVVGSQRLEFVWRAGEGQLGNFRNVPGEQFCKFRFRIQAGSNRGAALRQRVKFLHRGSQPRHAAFDLHGVAREFLSQRQRRRILGMRSSDLDDLGERIFLLAQFAMQFAERRDQVGDDAFRGGDMHRRRK